MLIQEFYLYTVNSPHRYGPVRRDNTQGVLSNVYCIKEIQRIYTSTYYHICMAFIWIIFQFICLTMSNTKLFYLYVYILLCVDKNNIHFVSPYHSTKVLLRAIYAA